MNMNKFIRTSFLFVLFSLVLNCSTRVLQIDRLETVIHADGSGANSFNIKIPRDYETDANIADYLEQLEKSYGLTFSCTDSSDAQSYKLGFVFNFTNPQHITSQIVKMKKSLNAVFGDSMTFDIFNQKEFNVEVDPAFKSSRGQTWRVSTTINPMALVPPLNYQNSQFNYEVWMPGKIQRPHIEYSMMPDLAKQYITTIKLTQSSRQFLFIPKSLLMMIFEQSTDFDEQDLYDILQGNEQNVHPILQELQRLSTGENKYFEKIKAVNVDAHASILNLLEPFNAYNKNDDISIMNVKLDVLRLITQSAKVSITYTIVTTSSPQGLAAYLFNMFIAKPVGFLGGLVGLVMGLFGLYKLLKNKVPWKRRG